LWYDVMLSPTTPVSLYDASAGVDGVDGATVSTENRNGVIVFAVFGASSLPVKVCGPLASAVVAWMHTLEYMLELNVPIVTPSTNTRYDDRPPSPINQKLGVALELAVLSEPICKFVPHVPLSNCARFVVHADAPPANNPNTTNADTTTPAPEPTTQRRENLRISRRLHLSKHTVGSTAALPLCSLESHRQYRRRSRGTRFGRRYRRR
jgi:hypothetical protein